MSMIKNVNVPTREERDFAMQSYKLLVRSLRRQKGNYTLIGLENGKEQLRIPKRSMALLIDCLKATSEGKPITLVPLEAELSTQKAADFLTCSRPHLIKLLDRGEIAFRKVGSHRRIKFEDLKAYADRRMAERKDYFTKTIKKDQELGLYDR